MGTSDTALSQDQQVHGVVPRFMSSVFDRVKEFGNKRKFTFKASLLEIYNEELRDLCCNAGPQLRLGENKDGQVLIHGLSKTEVRNTHDVMMCLQKGLVNRVTASTNMNNVSSRSHAVLEVVCVNEPADTPAEGEEPETQNDDDMGTITSKITFVDLAGSERLKRTGAEGARMKEGISINSGLLHLGSVINALSQRLAHIPYRNCILTRILQNALGGNSRTLFLACVSPATANLDETINTLRYAWRAKMIKNSAVINMDQHSMQLMKMKQRERILMRELVKERFGGGFNCSEEDVEDLMASERTKDYINGVLQRAGAQPTAMVRKKSCSSMGRSRTSFGGGARRQRVLSAGSIGAARIPLPSENGTKGCAVGHVRTLSVDSVSAADANAEAEDEFEEFEKVLKAGNLALGIDAEEGMDDLDTAECLAEGAEPIDTSELVARTQVEAQTAEIDGVKMECEEEMCREDARQDQVQQDLQNKQLLLKKLLDKTKDYRVRYNQLRAERDKQEKAMQRFELEKKNLLTKIKTAETKYLKLKRGTSNANGNNGAHIEAMKAQVKRLGEKVKSSRREMLAKERQIAVLKGLSNLAKRMQGKIVVLKQKKVALIADRRKTEQKYKQLIKDKTRALNARNKELQKAKRVKKRFETTNERQKRYLVERQRKLVELRKKLRATNEKYLKMVNQRIKTVVGKRHSRKRKSIVSANDKGAMEAQLRDYISLRVAVRSKANELKGKLKMRSEMLRQMVELESSNNRDKRQQISNSNNDVEVLQDKININALEIDLTNQELDGLMEGCPKDWAMLRGMDAAQRALAVQFLIDEFVSAQDDWRKLDDENIYNQKRGDEYKERYRLATENNRELTQQIQNLKQQLEESQNNYSELKQRLSTEDAFRTPVNDHKRKSAGCETENQTKRSRKDRMSLLPTSVKASKHVVSARMSRRSSFGVITNTGDHSRFKDALKRVRAEQEQERQKLKETENKRELALKGMQACDVSRAERNQKGNLYLRSNTRANRRMSMMSVRPNI